MATLKRSKTMKFQKLAIMEFLFKISGIVPLHPFRGNSYSFAIYFFISLFMLLLRFGEILWETEVVNLSFFENFQDPKFGMRMPMNNSTGAGMNPHNGSSFSGPSPLVKAVINLTEYAAVFFNCLLRILLLLNFHEISGIGRGYLKLNRIRRRLPWAGPEIQQILLIPLELLKSIIFFVSDSYQQLGELGLIPGLMYFGYKVGLILCCHHFQAQVVQAAIIMLVHHLGENVRQIQAEVESLKRKTKRDVVQETGLTASEMEIKGLVDKYFEWASFWKQSSDTVGLFLLVILAEHIFTVNAHCFMWVTSAIDISPLHSNSLIRLATTIVTILKIINLGNAARDLDKAVRAFLDRVMSLSTFNQSPGRASSMDNKLMKVMYLNDRQQPFKLEACKFFVISRSGLTAVASVIVTYQVILLQFQQSKGNG